MTQPTTIQGFDKMNSAEITIQLPPDELNFIQEYAKSHGLSVDELIDRYVKRLRVHTSTGLHPDIEKFSGIVPADIDAEKLYYEHHLNKRQ